MSFGGTVSAMISSLRANNNLRLKRNKYFDKDSSKIETQVGKRKPPTYKHLSKKEILEIREEISAKNKIQILKIITVVVIAILLTAILMILFMNYINLDLIN